MTKSLSGKRALLTGASRGLGVYIARALAGEGAELVLAARDVDKLDATARECAALGARVTRLAADVRDAGDRARLVRDAGELDVVVNNAGVETTLRLVDQSEAEVRAQIETNLLAPIELTRAVLPAMIARGGGAIVNVSSMSGKGATPFNSVYAATKYGLNGFTASVAVELHGTGVHVGVVCPGFVAESGMWASTGVAAPAAMREVRPERVARAVLEVIDGKGQVLVTRAPIRPLLALRELVPGLEGSLLRRLGIVRALAERAERAAR